MGSRSWWVRWGAVAIVGTLAACSSTPVRLPPVSSPASAPRPAVSVPVKPAAPVRTDGAGVIQRGASRWVPASWDDLPGFADDNLFEAWNAWIKNCERPVAPFAALCSEVRQLSIASSEEQRAWLQSRLQPYRVESLVGDANGLLTGYFEPALEASRSSAGSFAVPLYRPPEGLATRKPWYTRQEMDTVPQAQAALQGKVIAYLADPVDALSLQVQGSGRLRVSAADGSVRWVRVSYAGTNDQPFRSSGRWLLDQGLVRDASWAGIRAWLAQNPQRQQELLWSNPRVTFFREEVLSELDAAFGPRGAQGVALTPGRSIAVDTGSIPVGTPLWLASGGAQLNLRRLVLAQDTGSAIQGAVRADYFVGWGSAAGEVAGRLRQPLQLWVLWPK